MLCTYTLVLRVFFEIASSCINTLLPAFLEVFEADLQSTCWNAAELFCHDCLSHCSGGLLMLVQS